jgi:hypothetical protein
MFEAGFYKLLISDAGIAGLLSGSPAARADQTSGVFPIQLPEASTLPALVYTVIHGQSVTSVQGTDAMETKRVQIECYGRHAEDVAALQSSVKNCLLSYRGSLSDGTVMCGAFKRGELGAFEHAPLLYRGEIDFDVLIINTN